ncbi:MAG TPA: response regulator [Gemmataceae bacterium]|jgi:DNA-binding response OmpR family regulator|nr:response regulator [Gemmataceae bacterium]
MPGPGSGLGTTELPGEPMPPFRVLCVDDNHDCADSLALLLQVMGFETRTCYDGRCALVANQTFRPGICFIDLNMPGMDGDEVARQLLAQDDWQPLLLVAMTAMSDEASRLRTTTAGFDMHLVKPMDPHKLTLVVDALFRAAELRCRHGAPEAVSVHHPDVATQTIDQARR